MEIKQRVDQPTRIIFSKKFRTKVVAMVEMIIMPDLFGQRPAAYIHKVYTDDKYQGRGYASALVDEAIDYARRTNCHKVFAICKSELVSFYEKRGMTAEQLAVVIRN